MKYPIRMNKKIHAVDVDSDKPNAKVSLVRELTSVNNLPNSTKSGTVAHMSSGGDEAEVIGINSLSDTGTPCCKKDSVGRP